MTGRSGAYAAPLTLFPFCVQDGYLSKLWPGETKEGPRAMKTKKARMEMNFLQCLFCCISGAVAAGRMSIAMAG